MLKFEQLYYLYLVHRFNSVKLAAESIPVTPSAVSTAIHKLEKEIGISLLERTYRGIELTEPACKIAEAFGKVVEQMENVQKIIEQTNSKALDVQDKKHLTLYLSRGYYQGNLTDVIDRFENCGFGVNVPDIACGNERYLQFVNDDKNPILLNFFTEPADELLIKYPNVCFFRIATSKPCVYCAKDYPYIAQEVKEITPREVYKLPILLFSDGYDLVLSVLEMLEMPTIMDCGLGNYLFGKVSGSKMCKGKSWRVVLALQAGMMALCFIVNPFLILILSFSLFNNLYETAGYTKIDLFPAFMHMGMMLNCSVVTMKVPWTGMALIPMGAIQKATGLIWPFPPYLFSVIP